jgi:uncharacterized protein with HEPN domain
VKSDRIYLSHILECIRKIEEDTNGGRTAFNQSHLIQDAVIRNLQVIAESTKRLSDATKAKEPQVNWAGIAGLRNLLVHDYFSVDLGIVWKIVSENVPHLKNSAERLMESVPGDPAL